MDPWTACFDAIVKDRDRGARLFACLDLDEIHERARNGGIGRSITL